MAIWGTVSTWRQRFRTHSETMLLCCLCYKRKRELLLHFKNLLFWKLEKFFCLKFPKKYKCWYFLHHLKMPLQRWRIFRDFPAILYVFNYINHLNLCENKKELLHIVYEHPLLCIYKLEQSKMWAANLNGWLCLYYMSLYCSPMTSTGWCNNHFEKRELIKAKMNIILSMKQNHRIVIENVNDNTCIV